MSYEYKHIYIDLVKDKNKSRVVVFATLGFATVIVLGTLLWAFSFYKETSENIYIVTGTGNTSTAEKISELQQIPDDIKFQLTYLLQTYYTISFDDMDSRNDVLEIMNESDAIRLENKYKDYWEDFRSQSLTQKAVFVEESLKLKKISDTHYQAECKAVLSVTNAGYQSIYNLYIRTKLEKVKRQFPLNPNGFIFYQFEDKIEATDQKNIRVR